MKWISESVDLGLLRKKSDSDEQMITFHNGQEILVGIEKWMFFCVLIGNS